MDRLSINVLRYLKKQNNPILKETITEKYGTQASKSLRYLEDNGYIKSGKELFPHLTENGKRTMFVSDGKYEITSLGIDFLQHKPGNDFDRWLNRISMLASMLGGALLSKPLWLLIEWIIEWIKKYL